MLPLDDFIEEAPQLEDATYRTREESGDNGPLSFPTSVTLQNYADAITSGFGRYFLDTVVVTVGVVAIVLLLVAPLRYAIVRSRSRAASFVFRFFLLGLAVPAQAVIVPAFHLRSGRDADRRARCARAATGSIER